VDRVELAGNNDFATLKQTFSPSTPGFRNTLVFDAVESTDHVHELKVTESYCQVEGMAGRVRR